MSEEFELNSLSRFRKKSSQFVLEQYSHCEVPAGCGGAVIRWRNPLANRSVILTMYWDEAFTVQIDGHEIVKSLFDLSPGRHALTLSKDGSKIGAPKVMCVLKAHNEETRTTMYTTVSEPTFHIMSIEPQRWRFTTVPPTDHNWLLPNYDDSSWANLIKLDQTPPPDTEDRWYEFRHCQEAGAFLLGAPMPWKPSEPYFIRFEFEIPQPIFSTEKTDGK